MLWSYIAVFIWLPNFTNSPTSNVKVWWGRFDFYKLTYTKQYKRNKKIVINIWGQNKGVYCLKWLRKLNRRRRTTKGFVQRKNPFCYRNWMVAVMRSTPPFLFPVKTASSASLTTSKCSGTVLFIFNCCYICYLLLAKVGWLLCQHQNSVIFNVFQMLSC